MVCVRSEEDGTSFFWIFAVELPSYLVFYNLVIYDRMPQYDTVVHLVAGGYVELFFAN